MSWLVSSLLSRRIEYFWRKSKSLCKYTVTRCPTAICDNSTNDLIIFMCIIVSMKAITSTLQSAVLSQASISLSAEHPELSTCYYLLLKWSRCCIAKTKIYSALISEYQAGVEEQARNLTRKKNSGRNFSPLKWTWTILVWQLARGNAQVNIEFEFASITSLRADGSF